PVLVECVTNADPAFEIIPIDLLCQGEMRTGTHAYPTAGSDLRLLIDADRDEARVGGWRGRGTIAPILEDPAEQVVEEREPDVVFPVRLGLQLLSELLDVVTDPPEHLLRDLRCVRVDPLLTFLSGGKPGVVGSRLRLAKEVVDVLVGEERPPN